MTDGALRRAVEDRAAGLMAKLSRAARLRRVDLDTYTQVARLETNPAGYMAEFHVQVRLMHREAGVTFRLYGAPLDLEAVDRWLYPQLARALAGAVWTDTNTKGLAA